MENGHRNEVAKNRAKTGAQGIVNQKPSFMSDGRAAGWWDKLGVHNIIIKHPIQPKKKDHYFIEESLGYQERPKLSTSYKITMFNSSKPVALYVHSKQQNNIHRVPENRAGR